MHAASRGYKNVCELLLDKGAKADTMNKVGKVELTYAAWNGHEDICKLLLERGCEVNAAGADGFTAMMLAELQGHKEVYELLEKAARGKKARQSDRTLSHLPSKTDMNVDLARYPDLERIINAIKISPLEDISCKNNFTPASLSV